MKGDFSRFTFEPARHYTQLPLQQGRVLVDADWNEQGQLSLFDQRLSRRAIIGPSGGPQDRAALRLEVFDNAPWIGVGGVNPEPFVPSRPSYAKSAFYWVEGCTLTQEQAYPLTAQPHLALSLPTTTGYYVAWVDVFERLLTALDVPDIREVAMGGPDHGTRVQQVWQVRLHGFAGPSSGDPDCFDIPASFRPAPPTGRLHARAADPVTSQDPCVVPRTAGYRRLENQLYRVEIRDGGSQANATFVWSRDNGIVRVRAIEGSYPATGAPSIQVSELGRDELTRLAAGDFIEITDEARTLQGTPGYLCRIASVSSTTLTLEPGTALTQGEFDALKSPTVRRWETVDESKHVGASYLGSAAYPVSATIVGDPDQYFELEDGVQVRFAPGTYRSGDYWLIPARTTSGDVQFGTTPQLPHGVTHHTAALGILHRDGAGAWRVVRDCRNLFPPLTQLKYLRYVGGDGQEALPGALLDAPLEVAVSNGLDPVAGVDVVFNVDVASGTPDTASEREARGYLLPRTAVAPDATAGSFSLVATTDAQGIAAVRWVLGAFDPGSSAGFSQHVTASVDRHSPTDPAGELHFSATQSIARRVQVDISACPTNEEDPTLQTVQALMGIAGLDPANPDHQNVQHVLHQVLCRLNARHVPYVFPTTPIEIAPAQVGEVKTALDALYWLVLQRDDCCCLSDVLKKLAESLSGKQGEELCKALAQALDGDCSLLEVILGAALNLVRVVYAIALSFLDLQDAPGEDKGYAGLKLGDETGIELDAFILGEGPGWFVSRAEERADQVSALGDSILDLILSVLEKVFERRGIDGALKELAAVYGQPGEAWNGPATRQFILSEIWEKLFGSRRLDDSVLVVVRDLLMEVVRDLWKAFVELLLCGEPLASRIPAPQWLADIDDDLGRAFERAFKLHGLVRELPEEQYGTPLDVHMVAPSAVYPAGASWVVSNGRGPAGGGRVIFARWRHERDGAGPLPALSEGGLSTNAVLPEPELVIATRDDGGSVTTIDSVARRNSLHCLVTWEHPQGLELLLWSLHSAQVAGLEGRIETRFPQPTVGTTVSHPDLPIGATVLASGGPDDPPTLVGWTSGDLVLLNVWPVGFRDAPFAIPRRLLAIVGVPPERPSAMHAFGLVGSEGKPGRLLALALTRFDDIGGETRQRNILLLLEGRSGAGIHSPWWDGATLAPVAAWDLPVGARVVGGAHDAIAVQFDGGQSGVTASDEASTSPRWALLRAEDLATFDKIDLTWDDAPKSVELVIPDDRWRDGDILSVVHGNDGPWIQALGPLSGRLGLYRALQGAIPPLQRQMVRGAASGESAASEALNLSLGGGDGPGDGQVVRPDVSIEHDYMLQSSDANTPRLLTVTLRTGDGSALVEFNASPRN